MIRFSISQKLMCAFLGLTFIVLVATLGLARWSFEKGFLDYVNALEQHRLTIISEEIAALYLDNTSGWAGVDLHSLEVGLSRPPSHNGDPLAGEHPFPHEFDSDFLPPQRPHRRKGGGALSPPTALYDVTGKKIAGHILEENNEDKISVPIMVDGQAVAWLRSEPKRQISSASAIETAFSRQQWVGSLIIGLASLILTALVAWALTRLLVSPVHQIIHGVNRLSKGDYTRPMPKRYSDEFGLLVNDLNHLTNVLDQNRSARSRWFADISHELRTPLAILTGEIEALKDGIRPFGPQQLESLDQEVQRLRFLVDDLYQLSLSDIGGLRYEFSEVDLAKSVLHAINAHQLKAEEKNIVIKFADTSSAMVSADEKRIGQLLANILRNSLAYTNETGIIDIIINTSSNEQAVLEIHDTPPSVLQEDCNRLFEPLFRQDESRSRRSEGAGLGLAICRNIVEAHRGTIEAAPSPLGGLQMTITLPLLTNGNNFE